MKFEKDLPSEVLLFVLLCLILGMSPSTDGLAFVRFITTFPLLISLNICWALVEACSFAIFDGPLIQTIVVAIFFVILHQLAVGTLTTIVLIIFAA